jgi:lysophospholipase L1-like esterase
MSSFTRSGLWVLLIVLNVVTANAQRSWDTIPTLPDHYNVRLEAFKKQTVNTGKIMFVGNSITEGGNWKKLLNDSTVINRGISGDITFGILNRLDEIIRHKPSRLFLLIGINDISKSIPDEITLENVLTILSKIHSGTPTTKIYVQSILPTNNSFKGFSKNYDKNDHVITLNTQLKKYAERMNYTYVDLYTDFLDKESKLEARYSSDGLHLNAAGYAHWIEMLKELKYL